MSKLDTHGYIPPGAKTFSKRELEYDEERRNYWIPAGVDSPVSAKLKAAKMRLPNSEFETA